MIRKIHIIMLGDKPTFSNMEEECLRSMQRVYSDFEFKIWRDDDCMEWIRESSFASYNYDCKSYPYVSDYLRCRILYEEGGLYVDIDVFAINRIPDSYFEKSFLAWDVYDVTTNNGTCFYASEPKLQIFKEFCDCMGNLPVPVKLRNGSGAANDLLNEVLEKYGLDMSEKGYCDRDQDLGDIVVLNRRQFGARGRDDEGFMIDSRDGNYLLHACFGSANVPTFSRFVVLNYAIIDENTDIGKLKERLRRKMESPDLGRQVFCFIITRFWRADEEFLSILNDKREGFFRIYPIMTETQNPRAVALDYLVHHNIDIKACHDLMREDYCG